MGVRKTHDLAVKVGEYESNGETKSRYENVGSLMQGDNGPFILLKRSFNPAGVPSKGDQVAISCFEPRDSQGQRQGGNQNRQGGNGNQTRQGGQQQQQRGGYDADEEIPF